MIKKGIFIWICFILITSYSLAHNNIPRNNTYFVGRESELIQIQNLLHRYGRAILSGGGGMGKTQIAKAYSYKNLPNYDVIWWIDAEKSFKKQLINLSIAINEHCKLLQETPIMISENHDETIASLKEKLSSTRISWLIVLDNVKTAAEVEPLMSTKNNKNKGRWIGVS